MKSRFQAIFERTTPPQGGDYLELVSHVNGILNAEEATYRPRSSTGSPGGLIYLRADLPVLIVPDLHARMDFFMQIFQFRYDGSKTVFEGIASERLQVLCVGDGFHSERRAAERWRGAFEEFRSGYKKHYQMDDEMRESLGLMEMVMQAKIHYPGLFHFLKGNHENITNEEGEGNYPFGKFAYEGEMVLAYITKFYGKKLLQAYSRFEKSLPLLAVGQNFLVSHAEPLAYYPRELIIDCYANPQVIYGLTWTADDEAQEGSVQKMLESYLSNPWKEGAYYFGGHRTIKERYNLRAKGRYVQIHNPQKHIVVLIHQDRSIDLERDIIELTEQANV